MMGLRLMLDENWNGTVLADDMIAWWSAALTPTLLLQRHHLRVQLLSTLVRY